MSSKKHNIDNVGLSIDLKKRLKYSTVEKTPLNADIGAHLNSTVDPKLIEKRRQKANQAIQRTAAKP